MIARLPGAVNALENEPPILALVRARARRKVLWLRHLWTAGMGGETAASQVDHRAIDRILLSPGDLAAAEADFNRLHPGAIALEEEIAAADRAWLQDPVRRGVVAALGLSGPEADLLALACACDIDGDLRRVVGYLADEPAPANPSAGLAARLFGWEASAIAATSPLFAWRLLRPEMETGWVPASPLAADPYLTALLVGEELVDPALAGHAHLVRPGEAAADCLYPDLLQAMLEATAQLAGQPISLELVGSRGSGRQTLAAQLATALQRPLLVVDGAALTPAEPGGSTALENGLRAMRCALLLGAVLYWRRADSIELPMSAPRLPELQVFGLEARRARPGAAAKLTFELPPLAPRQRRQLWSWLRPEPAPDVITDWNLAAAEVVSAARVAEAGERAVAAACRSALRDEASELFTSLPQPFSWDDIVLTSTTRAHLDEFEMQSRLRWPVYEEWGFGRLCPLGRGVCAMFAGPSGTGKTMAAQVISRSLGLDIYRVDLAGVVNKYIGETEKRLKRVFDACERADVLLLFDEADALFGQRTQVKDAHDRFANIEIDYLLQRMERFEGIAILATNRKGDLDKAFLRRLRFVVDFMAPGPDERRLLWHKALPPTSPAGEPLLAEIDWDMLVDRVEMSAAEIKLAALGAAFLARSQGVRIGMQQILAACRREMAKQGRELRQEVER